MVVPVSGSRSSIVPFLWALATGSPVVGSPSMWQTMQSHLLTVPEGAAERLCDHVDWNSETIGRRVPPAAIVCDCAWQPTQSPEPANAVFCGVWSCLWQFVQRW